MRMCGEDAALPSRLVAEVTDAIERRHSFVLVSDGEDMTAVIGDAGESADEVVSTARRFVGALQ